MKNTYFRFQQFTVYHDRCAHRVGTDGVLLGAWAGVERCRRILDIGTGSGLIALMAAQRNPEASVVGIEIDPAAAAQAWENVQASPFAQRIEIVEADVRSLASSVLPTGSPRFDCILCNPPFFIEDTLPEDGHRALARHASLLTFEELINAAYALLTSDGLFHVILPSNCVIDFEDQSFMIGLKLTRKCAVSTVASKPPKRFLLTFSPQGMLTTETEELVLQAPDGTRTEAYRQLTNKFYL